MVDITTEIVDSFRLWLPEFSDSTTWSDEVITIALEEADAETGSCRWGTFENVTRNFKRRGMFYYGAHWLTLRYPAGASDDTAASGGAAYATASKSVADESISYVQTDGNTSLASGDDILLTTLYGQEYLRLRRRAGMGALAV